MRTLVREVVSSNESDLKSAAESTSGIVEGRGLTVAMVMTGSF